MDDPNIIDFLDKKRSKEFDAFLEGFAQHPNQLKEHDNWEETYNLGCGANDDSSSRPQSFEDMINTPHQRTKETFDRIYQALKGAKEENSL
jgi:hypothetical protein